LRSIALARTPRRSGRCARRIRRRYEHCDFDQFRKDISENGRESAAWNPHSLEQSKLFRGGIAR